MNEDPAEALANTEQSNPKASMPESDNGSSTANSSGHDAGEPVVEKSTGPGPPPDGGLKAWLQVVGGFLLVLNTW